MKTRFGTSGNPPNFFKSKYGKDRINAIDWIRSIDLNAYEYLMTYGARTSEEKARYLAKKSKKLDVKLSVHGPYYVVLTSDKKQVRENSVKELVKTLELSELMNAKSVVLHPGFRSINAIKKFIDGIKEVGKIYNGKVKILPETAGKISQLGNLKEIIKICEETECEPCIDFAHVHATSNGSLKDEESFRKIILKIEKSLGNKVVKRLHCHFYPTEFTEMGERVHRAVMEKNVFPRFIHFAPIIKEFNMHPTLISESKDSQDIGALEMKRILKD
jgi:deoxyribonuclease-4